MMKIRKNRAYAKTVKNEYKFYNIRVNKIADMFSNVSRSNVKMAHSMTSD